MKTKMKRSEALEHIHICIGVYVCEWEDEDEDPEPEKFADLSNKDLTAEFCLSGTFNHVFDGTNVCEEDFEIIDD